MDIEWANGEVIEATIHSFHGTPGTVRYGSQVVELHLKAGESQKLAL